MDEAKTGVGSTRLLQARAMKRDPALIAALDDINRLSVWAVRYALGRATYAVSDVVEVLLRNQKALSMSTKAAIARDIEEQAKRGLGMDMDARQWGQLYAACKATL